MIRVYGHGLGYASFAQVTRGVLRAAEDQELLAGFVAVDDLGDELEPPAGATAPVAVTCGAPGGVLAAKTMGHHAARWLLLAPNSDKIPPRIESELLGFITGLLTPSRWGKQVLDDIFRGRVPVRVCQHGVLAAHQPTDELHRKLADPRERFLVGHFTSTNSERKGTRELLGAWCHVERGIPSARLSIYCQPRGARELEERVSELRLERVHVQPTVARSAELQNALYQLHHLIVQPSRAEGFGLVPLEARAAGVPVAATACTGHADHVSRDVPGAVVIPSGDLAPLDDMAGATAPTVREQDVAEAIVRAYRSWGELHAAALGGAEAVRRQWSWEARTGPVLRQLVEEAT